jgi:EVE domain
MIMSNAPSLSPATTWIFQANPKYFDIDGALASLTEMSWSVNQYKLSINIGDSVFVWKNGGEGGIVASGTVLTAPSLSEQDGLQFAVQPDRFEKTSLRVHLRIEEVYTVPLSRSELMARLPDLSILQSPQGTNFAVSPKEAVAIREMLATHA